MGDKLLDFIAFSRNRPIQLHALLSSMKEFVNGSYRIRVIHRYDKEYSSSLEEVKSLNPEAEFIDERSFRDQVIEEVKNSSDLCAFLVDDIIFKEQFDATVPSLVLDANQSAFCFSLRLGLHLDYCFPTDSSMTVPNGNVFEGMFAWQWQGASFDWGYPLSVDGHVFRKSQILEILEAVPFRNPNEMESNMQAVIPHFTLPPHCVSFVRSPLLNVPMNRVQDEFKNRCLDVSVEQLHDSWKSGNEIDRSHLSGYINHGPHEPLALSFRKRS